MNLSKQYKEIILGAAVALLGAIFWWFLKYVFYVGNLTTDCWVWGGILFVLWGIALCLAMLLIKDKRILYGSILLVMGIFGMFFNNEPFYYLVVLAFLFGAFVLASIKVKKEEKVQVNLDYWRIWKRGLPIFITVLCVLISSVYYFSPHPADIAKGEIKIPRKTFDTITTPLESLILARLPKETLSLDANVKEILTDVQMKELKERYNIEITETDTIRDFVYKLMIYQVNDARGPYKKFIPIGLAIALFLALKIVSLFYVAIVIMLSWLALKILIVLKFVKTEIETKEVETVKL